MTKQLKVLIAEDDPTSQKLLKRIIEKEGHACVQTSNGKQALMVLYENKDFDCLITDIWMPEMDGRELIKILRGSQEFVKFPVLAISAVETLESIRDVMDLGASNFIRKPVKNKDILFFLNKEVLKL